MKNETPIINILTYHLPFELTNQIYKEFQSRFKDAKFLIETYKTYKPLEDNINTVELLLSLSIFHRRVITNLDAAVKFHGLVTRKSETDTIKIGSYNFTSEEKFKLIAVVINYNNLLENFSIPPTIMEYYETRDFLKKLIRLKSNLDNDESSEIENRRKGEEGSEENIPF